jgi:hypothetical protein
MSTHAASLGSAARFHVPFEHGAWWSYFSTLLAGAGLALYTGAQPLAVLGLSLALAAAFVAQDWAQALLAALLGRRSQALSQWQAGAGWALAGLASAGIGLLLYSQPSDAMAAWGLLLAALGLATVLGLASRILQSGRGRKSLAATALLLASPALPFGALLFGFTPKAAAFWAWPLAFYPAATLAAQSYIRGFPEAARWAGPALAGCLGALALALGAWLPGAILLGQAGRLQAVIARRWREQPGGLPQGAAIRRFGQEQAAFGVILTLLWAWSFR